MTLKDKWGNPVSAASRNALARYEQAAEAFLGFSGTAWELADAAVETDPGFAMGHCQKAGLRAVAMEKTFEPQVLQAVQAAERLAARANERERAHVAALRSLVDGEWRDALRRYGNLLIEHPRDTLALQIAHALDFYLGQSQMLRDRVARVLPYWSEGVPGYGYLLGMHAFGLEETGDYARAEHAGREAVERHANDVWAIHAVSHVMEMQGRASDGIGWLKARTADWAAPDNLFAIHNAWHLALFHLDLGEHGEALRIYDERIRNGNSAVALDLLDASAMLWRLHLRGIDVGGRWDELADAWAPTIEGGWYAFNDFHAAMAFVGAGRMRDADALVAAMERRAQGSRTNAEMTREIGVPASRAIVAFGRGDYATAIDLLEPLRLVAHRFGGSHAQRDVLGLTLVEAALRGGQARLARALAAERMNLKPSSPFNRALTERARALLRSRGDAVDAGA
jgi:tetratricopeptide (TPR) repeat protein